MSYQSRRWVFTINFPEHDMVNYLDPEDDITEAAVWVCWGIETAPTTGQKHIQGYVFLKHKTTLTGVKKLGQLSRAHLDHAKGSHSDQRKYCSKEGNYKEYGTFPVSCEEAGKARKEKWVEIKNLAKKGKFDEMDPSMLLPHYNNIMKYYKENMPKPDTLPHGSVIGKWFYGKAGNGKSSYVREMAKEMGLSFYEKNQENKWWDNYKGEDVVIYDDIHPDDAKRMTTEFKKIADRFPLLLEIKGSHTWVRPKHVWITSQYMLGHVFDDTQTREALYRRYEEHHVKPWQEREVEKGEFIYQQESD